MKHLWAILLTFPAALAATAATDTMTGARHPAFRTVQVQPVNVRGDVLEGPAVIEAGSGNRIRVSFDELGDGDRRYMRYELIHCDALWRPEGLVDSEYLDGFNQAEVTDYAFSQATLAHYVNYRIEVPNEQMNPTLSGNYLLRVYDEDDPEQTLVQARFAIAENLAGVGAQCTSRTDFDYNDRHQQLTIEVDTEHLGLLDPFNDLKVVVEQDGRTDNAVVVSNPLRLKGKTAIFEHNRSLTFEAGNEYRRFEAINDHYPGMGVDHIEFAEPLYHYILQRDEPRAGGSYLYDLSRQGRYVVRRHDANEPDTEADYAIVHFTLEMPYQPDYKIYIEGDLTGRRLDEEALMVYNHDTGCYERALLLKQGAYSYQYLAVDAKAPGRGLTSVVEGDYHPTEHTYTVKVYHRAPGTRYDRLVGYRIVPSNEKH